VVEVLAEARQTASAPKAAGVGQTGGRVGGIVGAVGERERTRKTNRVSGDVEHEEKELLPISPMPELAGSGRGRAATPPRHGGRRRGMCSVRECEERRLGEVREVGRAKPNWADPVGPIPLDRFDWTSWAHSN
jgi:hypothetical protein